MKLKERSLKDFRFRLGILSNFSFEDRKERDGSQVQRDEERYGCKKFEMAVGQSRDLILAAEFHG